MKRISSDTCCYCIFELLIMVLNFLIFSHTHMIIHCSSNRITVMMKCDFVSLIYYKEQQLFQNMYQIDSSSRLFIDFVIVCNMILVIITILMHCVDPMWRRWYASEFFFSRCLFTSK